jgi:hypothetical protein
MDYSVTIYIVEYSLKARIVESQPSFTKQWPVNKNREVVFSAWFVPMVAYATVKYVMQLLSNNYTATEERCFLPGPYRDVISRTVSQWSRVSWLVND